MAGRARRSATCTHPTQDRPVRCPTVVRHLGAGASPHHPSHSLLVESTLDVGSRGALFGRAERIQINGGELGFSGGDLTTLYKVCSVVLGSAWRVATLRSAEFSVGVCGAVNFVPETLRATFDARAPTGFAVYLQVTPSAK